MTIIAIDGDSAAGKGTLARRLAKELDFAFLDTGLLYRETARIILINNKDVQNPEEALWAARQVRISAINQDLLRTEEVSAAASVVAVYPAVREVLLAPQRDFAQTPPGGKRGSVLDGRDIGTVVCPNADIKIFITASPEERALRRQKELQEKGIPAIQSQVFANMQERDGRDRNRATAPTKAAADAWVIDTTGMEADEVFRRVTAYIKDKKPELAQAGSACPVSPPAPGNTNGGGSPKSR